MEMTDEAATARILAGDIDVFEVLVKRYSAKLLSYVSQRLYKKEEADDIVQTSFIQLYKNLSRFDTKKPLYPYLMQITRNELFTYYRKNKITVPLNDEVEYGVPPPEQGMEINSDELLAGLKPEHKNALLWFVEGYSYKEIAKKLGKPLNTIRTIIRRARLFIQKEHVYEKE